MRMSPVGSVSSISSTSASDAAALTNDSVSDSAPSSIALRSSASGGARPCTKRYHAPSSLTSGTRVRACTLRGGGAFSDCISRATYLVQALEALEEHGPPRRIRQKGGRLGGYRFWSLRGWRRRCVRGAVQNAGLHTRFAPMLARIRTAPWQGTARRQAARR